MVDGDVIFTFAFVLVVILITDCVEHPPGTPTITVYVPEFEIKLGLTVDVVEPFNQEILADEGV